MPGLAFPTSRFALKLAALLAASLTGCVATTPWVANKAPAPPAVSQVHTYWEPRVLTTANILNGGKPVPGLGGRLFLFGAEVGHPMKADGVVSLDLFDASKGPPEPDAKALVHLDYDKSSLREMGRKDAIGWGYTLFIPWENYNPAVTRVQIRVRFTPEGSTPAARRYSRPPSTVTLRRE